MHLIVGLGNPGKEYEKTRHNIGFIVLGDKPWKLDKKSNCKISKDAKIVYAEPQTFMNNSGYAVKQLIQKYKTKNLLIIHDDIDLDFGSLRLSRDSGSAGHNGVQSIINELKTKEFWRLRIGVGPKKGDAAKFVLKTFKDPKLKNVIELANQTIQDFIDQGPEKTQNKINGS